MIKQITKLMCMFTSVLALGSCSGGSGSAPSGTDDSITGEGDTTPAPLISGFDFTLQEGDFWEYGWRKHGSSYAQGSSGRSWDYTAEFRTTLGAPVTIEGKTAYPLQFSGQPHTEDEYFVADRWTHIAVDGHKIYASGDGATLIEVFDATDGTLRGSGFFHPLPISKLFSIETGTLDNVFYNGSAYQLSESFSEGQCEYFPEVGQTICGGGEMQISYKEREYYLPNIGPAGYFYYNAYSSCGGGFCSGRNDTLDVGLVASSLRHDTVSYELEREPNNAVAQANIIVLPATIKGGFYKEDTYGATATINLAPLAEAEPNSTRATAQTLSIPVTLTANTQAGEGGQNLSIPNFPNSGQDYNESIEDWFIVTPPTAGTYVVNLDFAGATTSDLDVFVIRQSDNYVVGYSINNNLTQGTTQSEHLSFAATNQPYYVAVDAFNTAGVRTNYALSIARFGAAAEVTPSDWYQFGLNSQSRVAITATDSVGLVLLNVSTGALIDYGMPTGGNSNITSSLLQPGTYRIGVAKMSGPNSYVLNADAR